MFAFWLEEEYVEPQKPEVDWSKVPVDTLVRVKNGICEGWRLRYFKSFSVDMLGNYVVFDGGATSKTAQNRCERWRRCELVEDDDGSNQD